jgi:26S proteasome regulatory subunit N2
VTDDQYRQVLLGRFQRYARDRCNEFILGQLYHALDRPGDAARLLIELGDTPIDEEGDQDAQIDRATRRKLMAYQIAFQYAENASQIFRSRIIDELTDIMDDFREILTRKKLLAIYLKFLWENRCQSGVQIVQNMREMLDDSFRVIHASIVMAWSMIYAWTGDDTYIRSEPDMKWMFAGEKDWSHFTYVASFATIHNGRFDEVRRILTSYLAAGAPNFHIGGALYGLGLAYANYEWDPQVISMVTNALQGQGSSIVQHGACLGLGLIKLGSHDEEAYQLVQGVLNDQDPVAGEAAAYAAGLIMLGRGPSDEFHRLMEIAAENKHEKITRGTAMGMAFMMYGRESEADATFAALVKDRIPLLRECAAWMFALAYVGTASNVALKSLLNLAIADVNPDVRRAAVIAIGFVLSKNPKEIPSILNLMAKSYNPHVRNGAALAIGIACAGTGMQEAIDIVKPLLEDTDKFVRQSATIGMGMLLQQQADNSLPYCKDFRAFLRKRMTKRTNEVDFFGIALGYGLLNAGGRNVVVSCNSLGGENSILSTVGLAMFCNYFYSFHFTLTITLAFHPMGLIGLDENLNPIDVAYYTQVSGYLYADPPSFDEEKAVVKIGDPRALSVERKAEKKPESAETPPEEEVTPEEIARREQAKMETMRELKNPARVTRAMIDGINWDSDPEWERVTSFVTHGILMMAPVPKSSARLNT